MDKKMLMYIGLYGVAAFGIYLVAKNNYVSKRLKSIALINDSKYKGFEDAFLKEWGKASKSGSVEFTYKGKVYLSQGGTAKK
jgi:hypothetical protein